MGPSGISVIIHIETQYVPGYIILIKPARNPVGVERLSQYKIRIKLGLLFHSFLPLPGVIFHNFIQTGLYLFILQTGNDRNI